MLEIAICVRDILYRKNIENRLNNYLNINEIEFKKDIFNTGEEMIKLSKKAYNIIFIEIIDNVDWLYEFAEFFRNKNSSTCFVIFSDKIEYAVEGYKIGAIRFLLKKDFENSFEECMEAVLEKLNINTHGMWVTSGDKDKYIYAHKISYLESQGHYITFFDAASGKEVGKVNSKLDTLQIKLGELNFLRVHKSYLVNMAYIKCISSYRCILENGIEISVPKARYKEVKRKFMSYRMIS